MELFQYRPLKRPDTDLRLLKITSVTSEAVHCGMTVTSSRRKSPILYQALSYTWGDESIKSRIIVNEKALFVTINLEHALRHLDKKRYYWIDAVCINQDDLEERNQQIQRMREIYKSAVTVVIWLGRDHEIEDEKHWFRRDIWGFERLGKGDSDNTSKAFDLLEELSFAIEAGHHLINLLPHGGRENSLMDTQSWAALARFFKRAWFERLWVIQELESAQNAVVQIMNKSIGWRPFVVAAAAILRPPPDLSTKIPRRFLPYLGAERIQNIALQGDKSNILDVLRQTREAKCKDPRDRLYAISGILSGGKDFEIDYKIDTETLYFQWAWARIARSNSLDILSACADAGENGRPSWIPDLRKTWGTDKALFCRIHDIPPAQQCEKLRTPINDDGSGRTINLDGLSRRLLVGRSLFVNRIVKVGAVGDVTRNLEDPTKLRDGLIFAIATWEDMCSNDKKFSSKGTEMGNGLPLATYSGAFGPSLKPESAISFATALFRGYKKWNSEEHPASLMERFQVWRWNIPVPWNHAYVDPGFVAREKYLENFERILFTMVHGCQMFLTESGQVGMAGADCHVAVNDKIYLLSDEPVPYVLRDLPFPETNTLRLMGPCYVHEYWNWTQLNIFGARRTITIT